MKRAAIFVACSVILAACVNDFDALFDGSKGASDGGTSSSSGSSGDNTSGGGGTGDDDDTTTKLPPADAGTTPDAKASGDPTLTCGTKQPTCNDQRKPGSGFGSITNSCFGCGCTCPAFDCDDADGVCDTTCSGGATCTGSCRFQDDCTFTAKAAVANFTCRGDFTDCKMTCTQGSVCNFDCSDARRCSVVCDVGSSCLVKLCKGDSCSASPCPNQKTCADGSIACGDAACK